ncbi:GNAT family N-acetyltransferase [Paracoccus alkanivorans]|uniref:GNAT family N-acetyltransferase n=1 Tax=Paracoccus alkanivorans TaxID=2116655 RepID=A0A3M0MBW8_9RHOB|nr:GNAT family N-acetyltransferase [Paracoccus alkanivorans]RMC34713.1 GNAT family N-acetyltransferase [Paracoccus alkanivorans]
MSEISSRPYDADDFSACLAIFDSNLPTYFAPEERAQFCEFLENLGIRGRTYLVLTGNGSVVACGGLLADEVQGRASLEWGMVDHALHGQGLGTGLMQARLALANSIPGIAELTIETSQHSRGFYERFGFTLSRITPDGFGPGLDRWSMALRLS